MLKPLVICYGNIWHQLSGVALRLVPLRKSLGWYECYLWCFAYSLEFWFLQSAMRTKPPAKQSECRIHLELSSLNVHSCLTHLSFHSKNRFWIHSLNSPEALNGFHRNSSRAFQIDLFLPAHQFQWDQLTVLGQGTAMDLVRTAIRQVGAEGPGYSLGVWVLPIQNLLRAPPHRAGCTANTSSRLLRMGAFQADFFLPPPASTTALRRETLKEPSSLMACPNADWPASHLVTSMSS